MQKVKKLLIILLYIGLILINTKVYAKTAKAVNETVRIRKEASTDSGVVTLVSQGEEVEILEEQGEWYKVNYKTYSGYIRKDMLSVNEENTEPKEENTTSTDDTQNATVNETVTTEKPMQEENTVESNEETEPNSENPGVEQPATNIENNQLTKGEKVKLISNIEIRILPSINSSIIGTINESVEVTVIDIINKWCHIENEEKSGWVLISKLKSENISNTENNNETINPEENENNNENTSETQVSNEEPENTQPTETVSTTKYVSTETLNVRKTPDNNAEIIDHITLNTEVTVIENVDNTWAKIKVKQQEGYVASKYLSDTKTEITSRSEEVTRDALMQENENNEQPQEETKATGTLGQDVVTYAKQYIGCKYVSGGASPETGFDCSGFTYYVYKHFGITLNRTSSAQNSNGTGISKENLQPGDLLIFNNSSNSGIGHVGIYIGDNNFIHAANGSKGVVTTSLQNSYYVARYVGARRVIN